MGLFDNIEKLITEHGSAAILRERIVLAEDKYRKLEQENTEQQGKMQVLETENQQLKAENSELKKRIQSLEQLHSSQGNIDKVKENILLFLAKQGDKVYVPKR